MIQVKGREWGGDTGDRGEIIQVRGKQAGDTGENESREVLQVRERVGADTGMIQSGEVIQVRGRVGR